MLGTAPLSALHDSKTTSSKTQVGYHGVKRSHDTLMAKIFPRYDISDL